MKRIICYLRTIKEWQTFVQGILDFDAIYVAHDYKQVGNGDCTYGKWIKSRKRYELKLKCQTCGDISTVWSR
jgi:hypothetical protein